jgi:hypothetical protein
VQLTILLIAILALVVIGLFFGRRRALRAAGPNLGRLHSMPSYHGWYVALWCGIPSGIVLIVWLIIEAPILEALRIPHRLVTEPDEIKPAIKRAFKHADGSNWPVALVFSGNCVERPAYAAD